MLFRRRLVPLALTMVLATTAAAQDAARLLAPPLVLRPTATSFEVNVVAADVDDLVLRHRPARGGPWVAAAAPRRVAGDAVEFTARDLEPGARFEYQILAGDAVVGRGRARTQPPPGEPFTVALLADPHILVRDFTEAELATTPIPEDVVARHGDLDKALYTLRQWRAYGHAILPRVAGHARDAEPDLVINLGDVIDLHGFGFNVPVPSTAWARKGFLDYRRLLGPLGSEAAHVLVIGNWDGEKGSFTADENERARRARLAYLPGARPDTYPQGGGEHQNYFAFRWGDALFVVLDVMSYTTGVHMLDRTPDPGRPDDYTLGDAQMRWLEETLAAADARWRFVCIHHSIGGNGADAMNSAYGRGGGRAAHVGEQARLHALMVEHGVAAMFYGHDHVFTDMVVDGVHYTLPGSCGAPWKFGPSITGYERAWLDSGHGLLDVAPEAATVRFVDAEARELFRYRIEPRTR